MFRRSSFLTELLVQLRNVIFPIHILSLYSSGGLNLPTKEAGRI